MKKIIGYIELAWLMKSPSALFSSLFDLPWYRNMLEQWIEPMPLVNTKALEVGCAAGDFSRALAERNIKVWGTDCSSRILKKARQIPSTVQFKQADATRLPFSDQYFDVVLAASLINVVNSPRAVLAEMLRVCRTGGTVTVLVPNRLFSDADAKQYIETEQLSGFSGVAFLTWHRMGRKMDSDVLHSYFNDLDMSNIITKTLLGGMVFTMSGQPRIPGEIISER